MQKMSDNKLVDCPECGKPKLERLLGGGGAGFVLKGEGFYQNDYGSGSSTVGHSANKRTGGDSGPSGGG